MAESRSTLVPSDPLCWTYAGIFDDMLALYPWPKIKTSATLLDIQLTYGVVTGRPFLLNDGYLVLNSACLDSLAKEYSPLRVLIRQGYLKVLSRNSSRSLRQMVKDSAAHGIRTYQELVKDGKRWSATQKILETVDAESPCFAGWPSVDLTASYRELIHSLSELSPQERGLDNVTNETFQDILKRFDDALSRDPSKPRSKWEEIILQNLESDPGRLSLMQMANEVYHHNFGVALTARPPEELPKGSEIAVLSRTSEAFSHLYKSHAPKTIMLEADLPQMKLPSGVDYSDGNLLRALLDRNEPIGETRSTYLQVRKSFVDGISAKEDFVRATQDYQNELDKYLARYSPSQDSPKRLASHMMNFGVSATTVALSIAGIGTALIPKILIGGIAFITGDFVFPVLMEKYRADKAFGWAPRGPTSRPPEWRDAIVSAGVMTALPVDEIAAKRIVGHLPMFSATK